MTSMTHVPTGPPRRRARLSLLVVAFLGVLMVVPRAAGTRALLAASLRNPAASYGTAALYAPTALTATASGHDVALGWTAGRNGNGYTVAGVANGASSDCTAASYGTIGTTSGTSYTDTGRFSPQGTWWCYRATTTYGAWTSVTANPTRATRIGFFVDTAVLSNGGGLASLDTGDQIVLTFNQPVATASGPTATETVCTTLLGPIYIGSATTSGSCSASEAPSIGTLTGSTVATNARWNANYTWSNSNKTLTVVLGTKTTGLATTIVGTSWTLNPTTQAAKLLSATGTHHVCDSNVGGGTCLPAATGSLT